MWRLHEIADALVVRVAEANRHDRARGEQQARILDPARRQHIDLGCDAEPRPAERARLNALDPPPRLRRFDLRHRRVRYDPAFRVGPQILTGVKSEAIEAMIEGPERRDRKSTRLNSSH